MSKGFASNRRIGVLATLVLLSFSGLVARLVWLHVIDRAELLDTIEKARRQIIVEQARRGDILDAHDNILATSRSLIELGVDPQLVRQEDEKKWPQLAALAGVPESEVARILTTKFRAAGEAKAGLGGRAQPFAPSGSLAPSLPPVAAQTNGRARPPDPTLDAADDDTELGDADEDGSAPIQWARLSPGVSESAYAGIQKLGIRGVYGNRFYRRDYPHNELAAHVIGYVNRAEKPVTGIEAFADFYLSGQNGWVESEKDGRQVELAQFRTRDVPPADGCSVRLSIDAAIQHIAEAELAAIAAKYQPLKATIIIGDPRTGFILALANYPSFNLNAYGEIPKDEQGRMRNIAVTDMYEPGSVFKIVAAAGALDQGLVTPETKFDCTLTSVEYKGKPRELPREDVSDHFDHPLSVAEIIEHSSNKGAAQLAMLMGDRSFYDYARAFGFGQSTDFPAGEIDGKPAGGEIRGRMAAPEKWDGETITRMPMGQSVAATPMQMHQAMGTIASGGILLRPQVIREVRDASGAPLFTFGPAPVRRVVNEATARTMAQLLEKVASKEGTAVEAAIPGFDVAGKTGTAQKAENGHYVEHHHIASFVGFFPAGNPQVEITVIVDDADAHTPGGTAYGHMVAAPSFKRIGEQLIPYLNIQPVNGGGAGLLALGGGAR